MKKGCYFAAAKASMALAFVALILLPPAAGQAQSVAEQTSWLVTFQGEVTAISTSEIEVAVSSRGVAFTDRPERRVAMIDIADFVETQWGEDGSFTADPPNVSLFDEHKGLIAIVEITKAVWLDGVLRLMITRLNEGGLPTAGDYVGFVIDDYAGNVNNSIR